MKPIDRTRKPGRRRGPLAKLSGLAALVVYALLATVAQASPAVDTPRDGVRLALALDQ